MKLEYSRNTQAKMFDSAFFEATSKVHPVTPFLLYVPLVLGLLGWSLATGRTSVGYAAAAFPAGWLTWSLMEYGIHRFAFHWEGNSPFTRKLHDVVHGYHHKYPDDATRLVMPLGASIPLALVIAGALWLLGNPAATLPYFCGIVAGYLFYDFTHWSTHYRTPLTKWGRAIRAHHMAHHFADPNANFGISHRWVDALVGTLRRRAEQSSEQAT
jgi:sterol desaturase/sphingolipid hydroxylase (fatty acid hydroxylase superfamily)